MDCKEIVELLDVHAAGELDSERAEGLRRHLADCANCSAELELCRGSLSVLKEAGGEAPGADKAFFRGLAHRLDELDVRLGRRRMPVMRWNFIGGVVAAAAAVLIVANVLLPSFTQPVQPEGAPSQSDLGEREVLVDYTLPYFSSARAVKTDELQTQPLGDPWAPGQPPVGYGHGVYPASTRDASGGRVPRRAPMLFLIGAPADAGVEHTRLLKRIDELEARLKTMETRLQTAPR